MPVPAALQATARSRASRSNRKTMMRTTDGSAHALRPVPLLGAGSRRCPEVLLERVSAAHPVLFSNAGPQVSAADYRGMGTWKREGLERGARS